MNRRIQVPACEVCDSAGESFVATHLGHVPSNWGPRTPTVYQWRTVCGKHAALCKDKFKLILECFPCEGTGLVKRGRSVKPCAACEGKGEVRDWPAVTADG